MRSFLLGLLVAALCWWLWGRSAAAAGPELPSGGVQGLLRGAGDGAGSKETHELRVGGPPAAANPAATPAPVQGAKAASAAGSPAGPLAAEDPAAAAAAAAPATPPAALPDRPLPDAELEPLLNRLQRGEAEAYSQGWAALVPLQGGARERLAQALQPAGDDFRTLVVALGTDNAFLHSAEGRGMAQKATTAAMALPDGDAVAAGTQLLNRMLRGRVMREDKEARLCVDDTYRQHRIRVDRWLCDPANVTASRSHVVQKGESLARIATRLRKEGLAIEDGTLAVLNRIHNPSALQAGQKIKIPQAPIVGVLEKRSFGFAIYVGEHLLRLYWVGHGANDRTPVTEFKVGEKQPQPAWTSPEGGVYPYGHPKNILGEYFIKFLHDSYTGFGAHGTTLPDTIGTMSSMGCIRMYDADIAELFKILPRGASVVVRATESLR